MAIILETDTVFQMAVKIFEEFNVNQSCSIKGFVTIESEKRVVPKGEMVIKELEEMFQHKFMNLAAGRWRHKRKVLPNSIGGLVAQKIWKYKRDTRDGMIVYTVWRVQ